MRYIPTNCIRPGIVLGKTLYNHVGQVLLTAGSVVKGTYLSKIRDLGVKGIFIEDFVSRDITVYNAISEELRQDSVKRIKKMFEIGNKATEKGFVKKFNKQVMAIFEIVESIVADILTNQSIINNVMDIKVFDEYTYYHCTNVAVLSVIIGIGLGMEKEDLKLLAMCGILHDVGKVFIDNELLNKPSKLTQEEFEVIKSHSLEGFEYINQRQQIHLMIAQGVLDHHEKYDGTGYPNGKRGEQISLFGRIISVADVYDALTSDRVYRRALSPAEGIEYIMAGNATAFDPQIVSTFVRKIDPYPVGTSVRLSNDTIGVVIQAQPNFPMRPDVRIFRKNGQPVEPYELSLAEDLTCLNITIVGMADV